MYRILGLLSVLLIGASFAQAQETHIVDLAGTGDFTTIHDAVEAASAGDTIRVQPDQYAFTSDLGPVEIDKRLYIIGSGYMPVEDGGTELVDIPNTGYFDLTASADGTVIKGFRVQGADQFVDTESGTANVTIEENLFIGNEFIITLTGSADTVRSNIFVGTGRRSIQTNGANTQITNNVFGQTSTSGVNGYGILESRGTSGVVIAYNLFLNTVPAGGQSGAIAIYAGSPEVYSNGIVNETSSGWGIYNGTGTAFITNNAFYNASGASSAGLNGITDAPEFENFDEDNDVFDLDKIDEDSYNLNLATGSAWIDAGRTGTPYLDLDGSRSDIGLYAGPTSFSDGRGAPSVPVVIQFQVSPTTVSPSGTITITATGRIGDGSN